MLRLTLILENLINLGIISAFIILIFDIRNNSNTTQRMNVGSIFYILILI